MSVNTPPESGGGSRPNVARAGGIMVLSLFLSRVLGIVRDMIMAGQFGAGFMTDAYLYAFQIPDLLFFLIAGGALSSAFIPVFSEYLHTDREEEAWKLFSVVVTVMSIIVTVFIVLAWIFAPQLARVATFGDYADPKIYPYIVHMSRIVLPAQFAFFIGGIMFGTLYARQRFVAPGLGPNIYNIGIILGALLFSHFVTPPISGMSWGALIGAVTGNLLVPLMVMRVLGARFKPSLDVNHPGVKKVFKLMLPVVLGLSLPGVYALMMKGFASHFGVAVATYLDFSNKLMQAPLGIFGQSLAIAVFPALSQFFAQQRMDMFRQQLAGTMRTVIYITVPISALMAVLSLDIVNALLKHGNFTAEDALATSNCLRMFSIGIWAWCLHPVLMRGFFALQNSVQPIVIGTGASAVFVALSLTLRDTQLGYIALPLASSVAAVLLVVVLALSLRTKTGGLDLTSVGSTFAKCLLAASIAAGFALLMVRILPAEMGLPKAGAIVRLLVAGLGGAWIYYFLTRFMGMKETGYIDKAIAKITRSPAAKVQSDQSEIGRSD